MADLLKVMEREMLHSEHAAECFLAASRRQRAVKRLAEETAKAALRPLEKLTPDLDDAIAEYLAATEPKTQQAHHPEWDPDGWQAKEQGANHA